MKNEPWIDRVYKDNLQTREIKLDYAHWLQAERMIKEQEKQKKKKRFLFWIFIVSAISLISFGSFVFFKPATPMQKQTPPAEYLTPEPSERKNRSADTTIKSDVPIASIENNNDQSVSGIKTVKKPQWQVLALKVGIESDQIKINAFNSFKIVPQKVNGHSAMASSDQTRLPVKNSEINMRSTSAEHELGREKMQNHQLKMNASLLEQIQSDLVIENGNHRIHTNAFDPIWPIKVEKKKWAEKGIRTTLAQEANNHSSGSTLAQAGLEFFYHRSLNRTLFYGISAGYLSNFNKVRYAQVLTEYKYQGFGAQVNNYGIKPNWLQYGFLQFSGGLEWKKHRLMINARPEFLFATKGKLDHIQFSDPTKVKTLNDAQISSVNQGWLQNDIMNKISVTASLGYEFKIMDRVGLGMQLNRVIKSTYKPLQGGIVQNAFADWNTGFRLSYILK